MIRWLIIIALIYTAPTWTAWVGSTTERMVYTLQDTREAAAKLRAAMP